jgi:microcompartment protein CcmK/EutM
MRKLVLVFAMLASMVFASCGNSTKGAESNDSTKVDTTVVDSIDSIAADTIVAE